mmetsp:Transcript_16666/g.43032  ORF Transcript_16666/g.43032 Transcript_16666/m.43032 type:complete len:685 (+) Transcript_16666:53-2107(+)
MQRQLLRPLRLQRRLAVAVRHLTVSLRPASAGSSCGDAFSMHAAAAGVGAALLGAASLHDRPQWTYHRHVRCEQTQLKPAEPQKLVLSADCGGTTTRLMLYRVDPNDPVVPGQNAPGTLVHEEKYPNIMYKSLKEIMEQFLRHDCGVEDATPAVAVLALAGIVIANQCRFTNLDWIVDGHGLEQDLKIGKVELINDFVAQGYGMLTLADDEVIHLNDATPKPGYPKACIGAGTGLGQCFLVPGAEGEYKAYPSEGSHSEFAPRGAGNDELQIELLKYLKIKFSGWNRISMERIVSGTGICNIYEFLAYKNPKDVNPEVHKAHLLKMKDAGIIAQAKDQCVLCKKTLQIFAGCYGSACGNMALTVQPFGGLYITGGVTKRLATWLLEEGSFMNAYLDKGRVSPLLEQVPLLIVKSDDMGQRGAHLRAVWLLKQHMRHQAETLFKELDVDGDGQLSLEELQKACRKLGDEALGDQLLELLDTKKNGAVDFEEFCTGFAMLPTSLAANSQMVGTKFSEKIQKESEADTLEKVQLPAAPDRGNDLKDRIELAQVLMSRGRNRRYEIDPFLDKNQPVFKAMLWKLHSTGDRMDEEQWMERDFWINKEGNILYFSRTEGRTLLYCTKEDLKRGKITKLDHSSKKSLKSYCFTIEPRHPDGAAVQPTEFGTSSQAARDCWLERLEELRAEP